MHWPHAVGRNRAPDDLLRMHVTTCAVCADLAEVATAVLDDRQQLWSDARVPPAGVVWVARATPCA